MIFAIILSAVLIGIDQLLKYLATQYLAPVGVAQVVPGVVELRYVLNDGAAFSMLAGKRWLLVGITAVALLAVAYFAFVRRPKVKAERLALVLIFSGGVGNWIDRVANGVVVDYVNFQFVNFAVFNFADICVTTGFALLILSYILTEVKAKRSKAVAGGAPDARDEESEKDDDKKKYSAKADVEDAPDETMPKAEDGDKTGVKPDADG